jgi:hypothetical protein
MVITAFNLDKIAAFMHDALHEEVTGRPKPTGQRARDNKWHNPYTNPYPLRRDAARRREAATRTVGNN